MSFNSMRHALAVKLIASEETMQALREQDQKKQELKAANNEEKDSVFTTKLGDLAKAAATKTQKAGSKVANMSMADIAHATKDGAVLVGSKTGEFKEGFKKGREAARLNKLIEELTNKYQSSTRSEKAQITKTLKVLNAQLEALRSEA